MNSLSFMLLIMYRDRFFGSQYDDVGNLVGNSSLTFVAGKLALIATAATKVRLH